MQSFVKIKTMTTKTPKELLRPRYIVIADYPGSPTELGLVIEYYTDEMCAFYNKYPNIFRRLEWWEHRSPEEMPEYLMRTTKDKKVFKAIMHNVSATHSLGFVCEHGRTLSYCNYLPATHEEYTNYVTTTPSLPGDNN